MRCGRFKPALISKGLRQVRIQQKLGFLALQASPDFKGIKTIAQSNELMTQLGLQASPDFKGIKTTRW